MDVERSDLPPLFNQNQFTMRSTIDESGTGPPLTPEEILSDLCFEAPMGFFIENLHELFMEFVSSENGCDRADKDDIVYTYEVLRRHLKQIKTVETKIYPK
ncbi:MAG: hypothetical protein A3K54_00075 [Omnitrophica WOR_2 bacterium RBG_13_44_8]|nr:MAG: hypothetical protein A3K54_00075 [Omnitrophica WOR_2 bacterium RBG_13_44_8]